MPYQLILSEGEEGRDVGENVFFDDLPYDYEVYAFYYPSAIPNKELESKLRDLGELTGNNLFVNIGRLNDPGFRKIKRRFDIRDLPVIIVTAIDRLASPPGKFLTAYAKIDSKRILDSPDSAVECVLRLFNLFVAGEVSKAVSQVKTDQRVALISWLRDIMTDALKGIRDFFVERDISVSVAEFKFELKRSGG